MKPAVLIHLSYLCLALGIAGMALGVIGDHSHEIPAAILLGSAVISLSLQWQ